MKQQVYAAIAAVFIGLGLGVATSNYGTYPTYRLPEVTYGSVALAYAHENPGYTIYIDGDEYDTLPDGVIENISMFTAIISRQDKKLLLISHDTQPTWTDKCVPIDVHKAFDTLKNDPTYIVYVDGQLDNIPKYVNDKSYSVFLNSFDKVIELRRK